MKSPEEMKEELIKKYKSIEIGSEGFHSWGMTDYQAVQCAIIRVEGIIEFINLMPLQDATRAFRKEQDEYWNQVLSLLKNKQQ